MCPFVSEHPARINLEKWGKLLRRDLTRIGAGVLHRRMALTPTLTIRLPAKVRRRLKLRADAARLPLGAYARNVLWDHVEPVAAACHSAPAVPKGDAGR